MGRRAAVFACQVPCLLSLVLVAAASMTAGCNGGTDVASADSGDGLGAGGDLVASDASDALSACRLPMRASDAGLGACRTGRAYVQCSCPSGVTCEGGPGASSPGGIAMDCISDDSTSCSGCESTGGPAECANRCAPNAYAMSCGGPPIHMRDGGVEPVRYQEAPAGCVAIAGTPAGSTYYCCPCD